MTPAEREAFKKTAEFYAELSEKMETIRLQLADELAKSTAQKSMEEAYAHPGAD